MNEIAKQRSTNGNAKGKNKRAWGLRVRDSLDLLMDMGFITETESKRIIARMKKWDEHNHTVYFENR